MVPPDWRALSVVLDDRAAIYAEAFPAVLAGAGPAMVEACTHEEAQSLLFTFAGAWPALGRVATDPSTRFVYMTIGGPVCRFRGIELVHGAIVSSTTWRASDSGQSASTFALLLRGRSPGHRALGVPIGDVPSSVDLIFR